MSEVITETQTAKKFDPEAFAMNLAKAMESSGQALAAYLKPRENGELKDKPPNEIGEVIKTFSVVAEYWLSDKERASDLRDVASRVLNNLLGRQDATLRHLKEPCIIVSHDLSPSTRSSKNMRPVFRLSKMII